MRWTTLRSVCLLLCLQFFAGAVLAAPRMIPGKGAEAKTLLVYAGTHTAYSLGDALESLTLHLRRVSTRIEAVPLAEANPEKISAADYLIIFCPESNPEFSTNFLEAVVACQRPVCWIGFGADQLDALPKFPGTFEISPTPMDYAAAVVHYRDHAWKAPLFTWLAVCLTSNATVKTIMTVEDKSQSAEQPLCWQMENFTFFAGVPTGEAIGFLVSDMLLDFFQVKEIPESRVYLRLEDYNPLSNHRAFVRMVDYLYGRRLPFMVGVIPASRASAGSQMLGLGSAPEFASALRYAQQRGGRLILHGATSPVLNKAGEDYEFWDTEQDRPLAEVGPALMRERVQNGARQMFRHGLFPLAWQTPGYAASRGAYAEIGRVFSTGIERVQLSDATHLEKGVSPGITWDRHGRTIIPENLGYVLSGESNSLEHVKAAADMLTSLRGTVAGGCVHVYQPLEKLQRLVQLLESYQKPFLDLADFDNSVVLPDKVLLTGGGKRTVTLSNAVVRWKAYDRAGKVIAEETEATPVNGERVFERKCKGDYELFEFTEENRK